MFVQEELAYVCVVCVSRALMVVRPVAAFFGFAGNVYVAHVFVT